MTIFVIVSVKFREKFNINSRLKISRVTTTIDFAVVYQYGNVVFCSFNNYFGTAYSKNTLLGSGFPVPAEAFPVTLLNLTQKTMNTFIVKTNGDFYTSSDTLLAANDWISGTFTYLAKE